MPVVQDTRRVHENVAMVIHDFAARQVLDLHIVAALLLVPSRANDLMFCLDIFVEPVLAREVVEVGKDFFRAGVHRRPVEFRLE